MIRAILVSLTVRLYKILLLDGGFADLYGFNIYTGQNYLIDEIKKLFICSMEFFRSASRRASLDQHHRYDGGFSLDELGNTTLVPLLYPDDQRDCDFFSCDNPAFSVSC